MARRGLAGTVAVERRRVRDEDIHQAVVVEVEDGDAVAGGLEDVLLVLVTTGHVHGRKAGVLSDVAEIDGDWRQVGFDPFWRWSGTAHGAHALKARDGRPRHQCDEGGGEYRPV